MKQKLIRIFQKFFQYWDRNHTAIESIEKKNKIELMALLAWRAFWQSGPLTIHPYLFSDYRAFWLTGFLTNGPCD